MTNVKDIELIDSIPDYSDKTEYDDIPWDVKGNIIIGALASNEMSNNLAAFSYTAALSVYSVVNREDFDEEKLLSAGVHGSVSPDISFANKNLNYAKMVADRMIKGYPPFENYSFIRFLELLLEIQLESDAELDFSFAREEIVSDYKNILRNIRIAVEKLLSDGDDTKISDIRLLYALCYLNRLSFRSRDKAKAYVKEELKKIILPDNETKDAECAILFVDQVDQLRGIAGISDLLKFYFIVHCVRRYNMGCRCDEWMDCAHPDPFICKNCECPDKGKVPDDIWDGECDEDEGESNEFPDVGFDMEFLTGSSVNDDDNDYPDDLEQCFDFSELE